MTYPCILQDEASRKWFVAAETGPVTWTYHETQRQAKAELDRLARYVMSRVEAMQPKSEADNICPTCGAYARHWR